MEASQPRFCYAPLPFTRHRHALRPAEAQSLAGVREMPITCVSPARRFVWAHRRRATRCASSATSSGAPSPSFDSNASRLDLRQSGVSRGRPPGVPRSFWGRIVPDNRTARFFEASEKRRMWCLWPPKVPLWTLSTRLPRSIQGARRSAACEARV